MKPDAFAFVMATGIVSIAAANQGFSYSSGGLAGLAVVGMLVLVVVAVVSWVARPPELSDPDVTIGLFTFVTACAVLHSRLTSLSAVLWTLGVLAAMSWLASSVLTVRNFVSRSWKEL